MDQFSLEVVVTIVVPIVVAAFLSIPGILGYLRTREKDKVEGIAILKEAHKSKADATESIVVAATSLLDPLMARLQLLEERDKTREAQVVSMSRRLAHVEENNYILCNGVRRLLLQLQSLGATPVFTIDDELCEEIGNGGEVSIDRLT